MHESHMNLFEAKAPLSFNNGHYTEIPRVWSSNAKVMSVKISKVII